MNRAVVRDPPRHRALRAIVALVAAGAFAVLIGWHAGIFRPLPPILATLPGSWTEADHEFKARLSDWFPLGSSEDAMIETLTAQGFQPDWRRRNDDSRAVYVRNGLLCSQVARVEWAADDRGILTRVNGAYEVKCL